MSRSQSLPCLKVSQLSWTKGKCSSRTAHLFSLHEMGYVSLHTWIGDCLVLLRHEKTVAPAIRISDRTKLTVDATWGCKIARCRLHATSRAVFLAWKVSKAAGSSLKGNCILRLDAVRKWVEALVLMPRSST